MNKNADDSIKWVWVYGIENWGKCSKNNLPGGPCIPIGPAEPGRPGRPSLPCNPLAPGTPGVPTMHTLLLHGQLLSSMDPLSPFSGMLLALHMHINILSACEE